MLISAPTSRAVDLSVHWCQFECCKGKLCEYRDCCIGGKARREELAGRHYMDRLDGICREDLREAAELLCYAPDISESDLIIAGWEEDIEKAEEDVHRFILDLVETATSDQKLQEDYQTIGALAIMIKAMEFFAQMDRYNWRTNPERWAIDWSTESYPQENIINAATLLGGLLAKHLPLEKDGAD